MNDLLGSGRRILDTLPDRGRLEAELFLSETRMRSVTWAEGRLDMDQRADRQGLTIRLLSGGRQALASTRDFSAASARSVWDEARGALDQAQADPAIALAAPAAAGADPALDPGIFKKPGEEIREALRQTESSVRGRDPRLTKVVRAGFSEALRRWAVLNTNGVASEGSFTESGFGLEVLAEEAGRSEVAGRSQTRRFGRDLDTARLTDGVCEDALQLLGARPVASGNHPVVFDPWVGGQFLELVGGALCADEIQKGKSFFERPQGQVVGSPLVTFVDDGLLEGGAASSACDDEGVPRRRTVLVEAGRLKALLHDTTSARRDGAASTGNAGRDDFSRPPAPRPSNFILSPGVQAPEALLRETGRGFLVQEVMGMHTADPVSGDFSVGAQGRWIEGGRLSHGVKGVTLAGNLRTLLMNIDAIADDLTWYGSVGVPTFRVSSLTLGAA